MATAMGDNDKEIFERLRNIEVTVARIDEREANMLPRCQDHESRIRALEDESARRKGVLAAVATIGGLIGSALAWLAKTFFGGN